MKVIMALDLKFSKMKIRMCLNDGKIRREPNALAFHFYSCVYAIGSRPQWRNIGLKSAAKSVKTSKMNLEERIII